jgi:hypothetical protein
MRLSSLVRIGMGGAPRVVWCCLLVLVSGCRKETALDRIVPVEGTVTVDGQPLPEDADATVYLVDPESGRRFFIEGKVGPGGNYVLQSQGLPRVPSGKYRVIVVAGKTRSHATPFAPIYSDPKMSPLFIEIAKNKPRSEYDLKLTSR